MTMRVASLDEDTQKNVSILWMSFMGPSMSHFSLPRGLHGCEPDIRFSILTGFAAVWRLVRPTARRMEELKEQDLSSQKQIFKLRKHSKRGLQKAAKTSADPLCTSETRIHN